MANRGIGIERSCVCRCGYISKTKKGYKRHKVRRCPYKGVNR